MEQRRLRLGDILDDYCPRERRVTNHAIVAMIEEDVKQTRCTTCDTEHPYKGARVPKRRKKDVALAAATPALTVATFPLSDEAVSEVNTVPRIDLIPPVDMTTPHASEDLQPAMHSDNNDNDDARPSDENMRAPDREPDYSERETRDEAPAVDGPVHRPLIRATLPRPEGQKDARPVPEFTVRHAPARGSGHGGFRNDRERMRMRGGNGNGHGNGQGGANGNRAQSGGPRFQGNRGSAHRSGGPSGFRNGNGGSGGKRGRGPRG